VQSDADIPTDALAARVLARERRALAKAITLLESQHRDHQLRARELLDSLLPHSGNSLRIGISGVPGAGKSTFIETFGLALISEGHRVAVLAVDPSSHSTGGSILGDKTRMQQLSMHADAFIRPSPSRGVLGGVAAHTREAMLVCEAAGFDVVLVETVGVGQSEVSVANMTDVFVVMQLPNSGDELQAMKKGVLELADLVVVNKSDLDASAAERSMLQLANILKLLRPHAHAWAPEVLRISAATGEGVDLLWSRILACRDALQAHGLWEEKRRAQALDWMWQIIAEDLHRRFRDHAGVRGALTSEAKSVANGHTSASAAAARLLDIFEKQKRN
jgi:LAO/AO transport system kinase